MKNLHRQIKERANIMKENHDFSSNMTSLFSKSVSATRDIIDLPISAEKSDWEEVDDYEKTSLSKVFQFKRHKHLRFFVNEVLKESDRMMHHPLLTVNSDSIKVELFTHDFNDVSESDIKLAKHIDEIFEDIKFIQEF